VTLYGLIIVGRRRVHYGPIDPVVAREIFIREALVEGHFESRGAFQKNNLALISEVDELEAKSRRRDILVDPETLYAFYDELIPADICNGAGFEKWRKGAEHKQPKLLYLTKAYLMKHDAAQVTVNRYPYRFLWEGLELPLSYHFEPGVEDDGVTLTLPVEALRLLPRYRLEWLVPGMLFDKCVALVRALPKSVRKNFVPVPDFVTGALDSISACDEPLTEMLGRQLTRMSGVRILDEHWRVDSLEPHLLMNFRVVDDQGKILGQGRNLNRLRQQFADVAQDSIRKLSKSHLEKEGLLDWSCGELPEEITRKAGGLVLKSYPALVDQKTAVAVQLFESRATADAENRQGLTRLLRIKLSNQLKFALGKMPLLKETKLLATNLVNHKQLEDDLQNLLVVSVFLSGEEAFPRNRKAFEALIEAHKGAIEPCAEKLDPLLNDIFRSGQTVSRQLKGKISFDRALAMADIKQHLARLLTDGFMGGATLEWLSHYPRYLRAIELRLEKLPAQVNRDRAWTEELTVLQQKYQKRLDVHHQHKLVDPNLRLFRWMIEEYRVSLFAQQLGTRFPVSDKRLRKLWGEVADV
ncbi:MAG: DUF3418 domain-containing protein, partial [Endozoicomonas sp.]